VSDFGGDSDWELVDPMALVPSSPGVLASTLGGALQGTVDELRRQLSVVKSALDSRDSWEAKAAAHEAQQVAQDSLPKQRLGGNRGGSSRGSGKSKRSDGPVNRTDLSVRKANLTRVPNTIPSNINGRTTWFKCTTALSNIGAQASSITETNYYFTLGSFQQSSALVGLFDQYCIVQASLKFSSVFPPGLTSAPNLMHSAIDLDNSASLGSVNLIDAYETVQVTTMGPQKVLVRSVRPAVAPDIGGSSGAGSGRMWVDTAYSSIPHYGIRTILTGGSNYTIMVEQTMWVAFRSGV
jgi:hypothetical protein